MCKLTGRNHSFAVCNGSAALELAVQAIGIKPGDEVIMPAFTIISCALAVVRAGAVPVYVDSDPQTWNMQVSQIEELITEKTTAIMAVHIYGITVDMDPLLAIARRYNLKVIEDAAEVIGQTYKGRPCGSFGDISTFSFYPNKHITTGEGGMVLTDQPKIAERCKSMRNLCFGSKDRFKHESMGWNFRMSNLQAAVGVAQLERLTETIEKKISVGRLYLDFLAGLDDFLLPPLQNDFCRNIFWVFGLVSLKHKRNARWWINELFKKGIGTRPFFHPLNDQPALQPKKIQQKSKNAKLLSTFGFYLPSGVKLKENQIERVSTSLIKLCKS